MAKSKYRKTFKPKDFESYRKKSGVTSKDWEEKFSKERYEKGEGDYWTEGDDYWGDKRRAEKESTDKRKSRPLRSPKKLVRRWDRTKVRGQDRYTKRDTKRTTKRGSSRR